MSVVPHALSWVTRSSGSWGLGGGMIALVLGLGLVVPAGSDADPSAGAVGLAVALLGGLAVGLHMPFLTGGTARFSLVGTALAAGLLVLPPVPVTLAATGAALLWGAVSGRNASRALLEGLPFGALTLLAALIVQGLAPRPGPVTATAVVGAALGVVAVAWLRALDGATRAAAAGAPFGEALRRVAPVAATSALGNATTGLVAVLLLEASPWSLPVLAAPLALLYAASAYDIAVRIDDERSGAVAELAQRLSAVSTREGLVSTVVEGIPAMLGVTAAVFHDRVWTPAQPDAGPCPLTPDREDLLVGPGTAFGLGEQVAAAVATGIGIGTLVVWDPARDVTAEIKPWLTRIAEHVRGVAQRVAVASALAVERRMLDRVVRSTADGILVLDDEQRVTMWNPAMAMLTGIGVDEALGRRVTELLGEGPWSTIGAHDLVRPDGGRVWRVAVTDAGAADDADFPVAHVAVIHDVTADHLAARMRDDILSVVSHELRTPLTPIKASTQLLLRRWDRISDERRRDLLAQIDQRADHLARLVEDLILVGQLSVGGLGPHLQLAPSDLVEVLRERAHAVRDGRDVTVEAPDSLPALTDRLRVAQIVDHLLDNACKYSPSGSPVVATLREEDGWAVLEIRDQGPGIPPEHLDRAFERFERLQDPMTMRTSGAGLGLPIVKALSEALGGTAAIESRPGEGTLARVRLPLLVAPRVSDRR